MLSEQATSLIEFSSLERYCQYVRQVSETRWFFFLVFFSRIKYILQLQMDSDRLYLASIQFEHGNRSWTFSSKLLWWIMTWMIVAHPRMTGL